MAIITWYSQKYQHPTFYIVETPEGSLDLAYERNVADMYIEFGNHNHSIIITSNLNSSDFLQGLYGRLGNGEEKRKRTLDLLQYGQLSSVQLKQEHVEAFNKHIKQLGLPLIWSD